MSSKTIETDSKGIPLKGPMDGMSMPVPVSYTLVNTFLGAIGYAIAWFWAYAGSKQLAADSKLELLRQYDLGWLYLGLLVLKILQIPIGIMLGDARGKAKIHLPNQQVYKVMGAEGSKLGYVLMENEGALGDFNRAQRAWQNYLEQFATLVVTYVAASWVFPFPAFCCATIWAVARIMSASGYTTYVDGRTGGMVVAYLAGNVLQGMLIIVAIKTL